MQALYMTFTCALGIAILKFFSLHVYSISAPQGLYEFSPIWALVVIELSKLCFPLGTHFRSSSLYGTSNTSPNALGGFPLVTSKLLAQLGSISLLNTIHNFLIIYCFLYVEPSIINAVQWTAPFFTTVIASTFLYETFTSHQWIALGIQLSGILMSQWPACQSRPISSMLIYTLVLISVFIRQFNEIWMEAVSKRGGGTPLVQNLISATFGIIFVFLASFFAPSGHWTSDNRDSLSTITDPRALVFVAVATISSILVPKLTSKIPATWSVLASAAATCALYLYEYQVGETPLNLNIALALAIVTIAGCLFLSSTEDLKPVISIPYLPNSIHDGQPSSFKRRCKFIFTLGLPDFVVTRIKWGHYIVIAILVILITLVIVNPSTERPGGDPSSQDNGDGSPNHENLDPLLDQSNYLNDISYTAEVYRNGIIYGPTGRFFKWQTRQEDEALETGEIEQMWWRRRNPPTKIRTKEVAVCLVGNMDQKYAQDLEWLYHLYHSLGTYDVFVWLGAKSTPYPTRSLKPKAVSWTSQIELPLSTFRRWRVRNRPDIDEWTSQLWGMATCANMVAKSVNQTGLTYKWLLFANPNTTFNDHPLPKIAEMNDDSIYFWPQPPGHAEQAFWGLYTALSQMAHGLHTSFKTWDGPRVPRDYVRNLAVSHFKLKITKLFDVPPAPVESKR